jgi:hypothetical protein
VHFMRYITLHNMETSTENGWKLTGLTYEVICREGSKLRNTWSNALAKIKCRAKKN